MIAGKQHYFLALLFLFITPFIWAESEDGASSPCPDIIVSGTDLNCYGGTNGTAKVSISGGSGLYSISWSNGGNINQINGLSVGTYTVSVKDKTTGCSVVGAYVVESPDPITIIDETITDVKCYGDNTGAVKIVPKGGRGSYTFSWTNSSSSVVSTSPNLNTAFADNYSVLIKDAKNCTFSKSFTVAQPSEPLSHSVIIKKATCYSLPTGNIDLEVWGGTPSYTYSWSTGANVQDIEELNEGNYSVTVTDLNGCMIHPSFYVGQPAALTGTLSTTDVLCNGDSNGKVKVSMTGGSTPYSYSWTNSETVFSVDDAVLNNIPADVYQLKVTDANGCKYVDNTTITEPSKLTTSYTYADISCYGGNDGNIDVTVSGATPAYTYTWKNGLGNVVSSDQDITNMTASIYTVTITDKNGCEKIITQELKQPLSPIAVSESVKDVKCHGNNTGEIDLTVTGGTSPYNYNWLTGQTTNHITGLTAMTYNYIVTDAKSCTYSNAIQVKQPAQALKVVSSKSDVICFGESNGKINLTVTGGTTPYAYKWNNSLFSLSDVSKDLIGYPAESYSYVVKDGNDCIQTGTLTVNEPTKLTSSISSVNILCKGGNNGSVNLTVNGGSTPYQYNWNNFEVTEDLSTLIAGYYEVEVIDNHNCVTTNKITLTEPKDTLSYIFEKRDVLCNDGHDGTISIDVSGGTFPYFYNWSNGDELAKTKELTAGNYTFVVTDNNGCLLSDSIIINQPNPLLLNEQITPVTCYGLSDGIIDITPTGGTKPYRYTWLNSDYVLSAQTEDLNGFPKDTYQLEIVDSNGCFNEVYMDIPEPDKLRLSYTTDIVSCAGNGDGNIFVTIIGGNPSYTTTWSNGAITQDLLNITAGEYDLAVVDQKGCADSLVVNITEPSPISILFETTEVSCIDQHDGTAYATPDGGNGGYHYNWSSGANTSLADNLGNEVYSVTVVDVLGCSETDSIRIPVNNSGCINPVNTFTPNGDNYNDLWVIDNMYLYPEAELKIFNKWGNLVFNQRGVYEPWDGKVNGVGLPSEVYYYIIELNKNDRKPLIGNITIIR